ncbi:PREDICTED: uncharacterized protein LOC104705845 isoform X1 [Camelina sativa]|uniref:Uncharacterized protein LOC104705845 isoform X1 n=1 Tax=Camelina sativa TaxID=90675 RepID=A0ABM0T379_CAMSA|nr:PREDICTED: uncharacterized protein LOC104705845 isoform X1 [Camelina sativa]
MQTPLNQPDPTSLPTEIKSPCLFNHRSGMAITSADFSSPMSPEPWQAETEATVGEESSREMIFLRFWATILNTYHSLSLAALYLLSPETQNFPSLSLVSRCMYHLFRFITALFLWMNIKTKIGMLALQKDLPKFQKPRFYLSNPLLSCRLCLEFVALLGVRRLHQRTHLDRLSWMYKGYVRTMVFALLLTWSGESRNWFYQRGVNPHHPPYFLKLRSVDSCSVYCRSQSLCGILDHHLHGREDPPDLSRSYTYSLHLLITSLRGSTTYDTNLYMLLTNPGFSSNDELYLA